jgi:hypothetical protein
VVPGVRGVGGGGGGGGGTESTQGRIENKTATDFLAPTICSGTWENRGRKKRKKTRHVEGRHRSKVGLGYEIVIPYPGYIYVYIYRVILKCTQVHSV